MTNLTRVSSNEVELTAADVRHGRAAGPTKLTRSNPFANPFNDRLAQNTQPLDLPEPHKSTPLSPAPLVLPEGTDGQDGSCQRIYNDRNCCDEESECDDVWSELKNNPINNISLDITPSFKPDEEDRALVEQSRDQTLGTTGSRTWKNSRGEVLAEGRLRDYKNGKVVIEASDGSTSTVTSRQLSNDDICFVSAWWGLPPECAMGDEEFLTRGWTPITYTWKASGLCHKPLYFEEVQVERYGHTVGPILQPIASGAHFFASVVTLPYSMGMYPPHECMYALGYYRPGNCAPLMIEPIPLSLRGGLAAGGAAVGLSAIIP